MQVLTESLKLEQMLSIPLLLLRKYYLERIHLYRVIIIHCRFRWLYKSPNGKKRKKEKEFNVDLPSIWLEPHHFNVVTPLNGPF